VAVEQITQIPFYLDWKFWSFLVALIALALSQLPPIHIIFRRAKLEAEVYSHMHITHKVGNPNSQLHLILSNTGGRSIKVKGINLTFNRDGEDSFTLPAKNYLQNPSDKETVLFTSFKLKPGEEWAHIVNFLKFFSRDDDRLFRQMESNLRVNILAKREQLVDKNENVVADQELVAPLLQFHENKFKWRPGEYTLTLQVVTDPTNVIEEMKYRFVLFESESNELSEYKNDYQYGFGVSMDIPKHQGVFIQLSEA
jgi:hypothetical protein